MERQNLIQRLVERKLENAHNARPICVCMAGTNRVRTSASGQGSSGADRPQK